MSKQSGETTSAPSPAQDERSKKLSQLGFHTAIYATGELLAKSLGLLMLPVFTFHLQPEDYGTLEILFLATDIILMVFGFELSAGVFKYYHDANNKKESGEIVTTAFITLAIVAAIVLAVFMALSPAIVTLIFESDDHSNILRLMFLSTALDFLQTIPLTYLRIRDSSVKFVSILLSKVCIILLLSYLFVAEFELSVFGAVLATTIANVIMTPVLLRVIFGSFPLRFSRKVLQKLWAFSLPLVPAIVGFFIIHFFDRFLLARLGTLEQVGIYALAYKFGFLVSTFVSSPFSMIWENKVFVFYKDPARDQLFSIAFAGLITVVVFAILCLSLFVDDVLRILSPEPYWIAGGLVPIIAIGYGLNAMRVVFVGPLLAESKTKIIGKATVLAALANIGLNLLLIPLFGGLGAALATVGAFGLLMVVIIIAANRAARIKWNWSRSLKPVGIGISLYVTSELLVVDSLLGAALRDILLLAGFFPLLFATGFVTKKEREKLRRLVFGGVNDALRRGKGG